MEETHTDCEVCSMGSVPGTRNRIWKTHTDCEVCSIGSVPGTRNRIWMKHTQTARFVAWEVSLVLETGYGRDTHRLRGL